jgi:beta-lactamase regulating signal transducer with metallopeptidase domain
VTVVDAMLSNAVVAALLALVAVAVGYAVRSPAVRHAAWVIVLLKLVTPPLVTVPLPVLPASWGAPPAEAPSGAAILVTASAPDPDGPVAVPPAPAPPARYWPAGVGDWVVVAWAVGAVGWFAWQGRRVVRFRRRVRGAEDAPPEVAQAAGRIAAALGIAGAPAVKLATGIGSPMLWGWGSGAVVLFPRELLPRLSPEARDTLLAHELAHYLRRDHWVRVLEFVATGAYWWHPAVWLARGGIEAAEEECCDAWVVGGLAASPRRYAEALLATVDFEAELRRPCLPPGACAANRSARLLHRRLLALIHAGPPRPLRGRLAVRAIVVAALLTQPVLRAATPSPDVGDQAAGAGNPESGIGNQGRRTDAPPTHDPRLVKAAEPRSWATAEAPGGGLTVLARDDEVVLRHPDGTTRVLGPGRPLALAFAPGGRRLTTAGPGPLVRTWDDRGHLQAETRARAAARAVAYTPDGSRLLVLDAAGGVTVLDPQTLAAVASWTVEGPANSITCAPDNRTVAVSFGSWLGETGWVECRSIADGAKLNTYPAAAPAGAARFSPDGKTLVIGGWNGMTTWRTLPGGELVAERQLPKHAVATAAFSPDAGTLPLEPPPEPAPAPTLIELDGPARTPVWVQGAAQSPDR